MTPFRQRETTQTELSSLKALLQSTPEDRFATPMLKDRIKELESSLAALDPHPALTPEAEIFFEDGPAIGSEALEVTFTSHILDSYQNMLTNHYAAKHYGILRRSGRRRGEADTKLYLTALPRGSMGLQLSQPHVEDFVAAQHLSAVMNEISGLVAATAKSDQAFDESLNTFNPRVLKPLQRFIDALFTSKAGCRVVTGDNETKLDVRQVEEAYKRVNSAKEREEIIDVPGVFGGVLTFSCEFDFQPDNDNLIRGPLADEVDEETATNWNLHLTNKHTVATLKRLTVSTRTGDKRSTFELIGLKTSGRLPAKTGPPSKK